MKIFKTFEFPASSLYTANRLRACHYRQITWARGFNPSFLSTDADVKAFMKAYIYPGATDAQINSVADMYSQDPAEVRNIFLTFSHRVLTLSSCRALHLAPGTSAL